MKRTVLPIVALLLLEITASWRVVADELEPYSSRDLHRLCRAYLESPEGADGRACSAFVRGFIDGSQKVVVRQDTPGSSRGSFTERAIRTRLGRTKDPVPSYCIDGVTTMGDFVRQMLEFAHANPPRTDVGASALLLGTLEQFHRCPG